MPLRVPAQLNVDMVKANAGIEGRHAWETYWYEWPLNLRGILYYSVDKGHSYTAGVYLLGESHAPPACPSILASSCGWPCPCIAGNPMVIWLVLGCILIAVVAGFIHLRLRTLPLWGLSRYDRTFIIIAFCLTGYALNLLPYIGVKRSCFSYHYMPALMYGQLITGLVVDRMVPQRWRSHVIATLLVVCGGCFTYYAPWIYALPLTGEGHERRRWLPRWN